MTAPEPQAYVTEIWCPPADSGVHALHSRMTEPEPLPEPGPEADMPDAGPEADLGHDYDGPELRSGTPEYEAEYAEYLAWAVQAGPELEDRPVPYTLTSRAEALMDVEAEPEAEWDSADSNAYQARVEAGLEPEAGL